MIARRRADENHLDRVLTPCIIACAAVVITLVRAGISAETNCANVAFWGILGHASQPTSRPTLRNCGANVSKNPRGKNSALPPYLRRRCAARTRFAQLFFERGALADRWLAKIFFAPTTFLFRRAAPRAPEAATYHHLQRSSAKG
jgi:hypothetical protein